MPKTYNDLKTAFEAWIQTKGREGRISHVRHEATYYEHNWAADPSGRTYRRRGENSGRAGLDVDVDLYRRTYAEAIEDAFAKHAPGVLDPALRQQRVADASRSRNKLEHHVPLEDFLARHPTDPQFAAIWHRHHTARGLQVPTVQRGPPGSGAGVL